MTTTKTDAQTTHNQRGSMTREQLLEGMALAIELEIKRTSSRGSKYDNAASAVLDYISPMLGEVVEALEACKKFSIDNVNLAQCGFDSPPEPATRFDYELDCMGAMCANTVAQLECFVVKGGGE